MNNNEFFYDRAQMKEEAKATLRVAKPSPALVTFVYLVVSYILSYLLMQIVYPRDFWANFQYAFSDPEYYIEVMKDFAISPVAYIVIIALSIVGMVLSMGYYRYIMKVSRSQQGGFGDLYSAFPLTLKIIGVSLLMTLFLFLWGMLASVVLIVLSVISALTGLLNPVLIALIILAAIFTYAVLIAISYRYRLAYYLLLDHPDWGPLTCIRESKLLMRGHKGELFVLDLSFIGWYILCGLTLGILFIWKQPYFTLCYIRFYERLSGQRGNLPNEEPFEAD